MLTTRHHALQKGLTVCLSTCQLVELHLLNLTDCFALPLTSALQSMMKTYATHMLLCQAHFKLKLLHLVSQGSNPQTLSKVLGSENQKFVSGNNKKSG